MYESCEAIQDSRFASCKQRYLLTHFLIRVAHGKLKNWCDHYWKWPEWRAKSSTVVKRTDLSKSPHKLDFIRKQFERYQKDIWKSLLAEHYPRSHRKAIQLNSFQMVSSDTLQITKKPFQSHRLRWLLENKVLMLYGCLFL